MKYLKLIPFLAMVVFAVSIAGCGTDKKINRAKLSASKYWADKAYPGKAFDVQVTEAVKVDDGKYRVKALVDGEQRMGLYDPNTETFDEGYYSLSHERGRKVAELEEEIRYLKDRLEKMEKENYQMKLRLKYVKAGRGDPNSTVDPDEAKDDGEDDVKPIKKAKAKKEEPATATDVKTN